MNSSKYLPLLLALCLPACDPETRQDRDYGNVLGDASANQDANTGDASDGKPSGDASSDSGSDADASHTPCSGSCEGDTPYCDNASDSCVACLGDQHCERDPSKSRCVAGVCAPCETDQHCGRISSGSGTVALSVCDEGTCVQCTGSKYAACGKDEDTNQRICNSLEKTCSTNTERSSGLCVQCVADAQCELGKRCVPQEFDGQDLGYFCMWEQSAGIGGAPNNCGNARPFVQPQANLLSIDGKTVNACGLRMTTCEAFHQFSAPQGACGEGTLDDSACGVSGANDALCRLFTAGANEASNINRCTMPCGSSDDCRPLFSCNTTAAAPYCELQTGVCYGNADCTAGQVCTNKKCVKPAAAP